MGSFGMTPEMEEAIKASKDKMKDGDKKITPEMEKDIKSSGVLDQIEDLNLDMSEKEEKKEETDSKEDAPEKTLDEILTKRIELLSKSLRYEVTEDEKWEMFLSETHVKEDVTIIPGKFVASFKILNSAESKEVGTALAKFMEESSHLEEDYKNETTLHLLSQGVVAMGKLGYSKKLSSDVTERYKIFESLPVIFLDKIARKWNDFNELTHAILEKEYGEGNS